MADYCARELDDVVRRLLPLEILADIGIMVDAAPSPSPCINDDHGMMEELAAHLVGILGLDGKRRRHGPPPCSRKPETLLLLQQAGAPWNGTVDVARRSPKIDHTAAFYHAPCTQLVTAPRHGGGTGVFLPRAEVYYLNNRAASSPGLVSNGAHWRRVVPPRQLTKEYQPAVAAMKVQQQITEAQRREEKEAFRFRSQEQPKYCCW